MISLKNFMVLLLMLALLLAGLESVRSFFMANVIQPIALVFWAAWRIIASVDQIVYWILLIVACFILVMRLIPNRSADKIKASYTYIYKPSNRVVHWKTLLTDSLLRKADSENLRDQIRKLLLSAMQDPKEPSMPLDLKNIVETKKVPLSLATQDYLFAPHRESSSLSRAWLLLPAWLRSKVGKLTDQDTKAIDEILGWIETEMEINHDR